MKIWRARLLLLATALAAAAGWDRGRAVRADDKTPPTPPVPHNRMTHGGPVSCVAFSPDGKTLASGEDDKTIKLWDVATGKVQATLKGHTEGCLPWPSVRTARRWPRGARTRRSSCGTWQRARSGPPSRGTRAACCAWRSARTARRWPRGAGTGRDGARHNQAVGHSDGQGTGHPPGHTDWVHSLAFSPDGKTLASTSLYTSKLWDVATGKEQAALQGPASGGVVFSPDGKTLASGSVIPWEQCQSRAASQARSSCGTQRREGDGHPPGTRGLGALCGIQPRRQDAGLGERGRHDQAVGRGDGQGTGHPGGHDGEVSSVAFSPDGKTLVSGSKDKTIRLWDVATGKEQPTLKGRRPPPRRRPPPPRILP